MSMVDQYDPETGEIYTDKALATLSVSAPVAVVSAEVSEQVATSHRYPRRRPAQLSMLIKEMATMSEEAASECVYNLNRGGKALLGPSIRFAEIVANVFGNYRVKTEVIRVDQSDPKRVYLVVAGEAWDTETNGASRLEVTRSLMTSAKGGAAPRMFNADMTSVASMAAQSIARRDAILQLFPRAIWSEGYAAALDVVRGKAATLQTRRANVLKAFGTFGIDPKRLFQAIGIADENEIGLETMPELVGMWTALKNGETVETVLDRAEEARTVTTSHPITNPLAEPAKSSSASGNGSGLTTARAREPSAPGSTVAEKSQPAAADQGEQIDMRRQARSEPAGAISTGTTISQPADKKNAQATAPRQEKGPSGERYLVDALKFIAEAKSATMLRDWRKRQGPAIEAAGLTTEQVELLISNYEKRLTELG